MEKINLAEYMIELYDSHGPAWGSTAAQPQRKMKNLYRLHRFSYKNLIIMNIIALNHDIVN